MAKIYGKKIWNKKLKKKAILHNFKNFKNKKKTKSQIRKKLFEMSFF